MMSVRGLYGRLLNAIYNCLIKSIDSKTSNLYRRVFGEQRHYRMTSRMVHETKLWNNYPLFRQNYIGGKTVVLIYDSHFSSPGLADMLRAIVSVYQWCKDNGMSFKLRCISPFNMSDYLIPNGYDWIIEEKDLDYKSAVAAAIYSYNWYYGEKKQEELQRYSLNRLLDYKTRQIHLYTNLCANASSFYFNFHELFKLENRLEQEINTFHKEIGSNYITISFRFTQLLGDLKDSFAEPLPDAEKISLIKTCIDSIRTIIEKNNVKKTIVTSDSKTFLKEVANLPYVYLLPGEPDHINNSALSKEAVRKTFWDMLMISRAKKAYMVRTPIMYTSGFAKRAAMIGNVPFEEVVI